MNSHVLQSAKAYAALIGAVLTALVGTLTPDDPAYRVLTIVLAVVTALAVYRVPNAD
jgi:anaerobic C4-dicarboxylate transporter